MQKKAAVDIGSNSIRYLGPNGERRLITTRLAENIISTGKLSDAAIERSIAALKELAALAAAQDAKPYAYATSAVRDAKFGSRERFLALAGEIMPVRVLSGEEEATFARIGAGIADKPDWGLIDLGGGSCQLISEGFAVSAPMGCVRAKDICDKESDGSYESMREAVFKACEGLFRFPRIRITDWIGVGGTITTLAALSLGLEEYDANAVESTLLTRERIELLSKKLHWMASLALRRSFLTGDEARSRHPLLIKRHDVIVPGTLVLLYAMQGMGIRALHPSKADGLDGYYKYICQNT